MVRLQSIIPVFFLVLAVVGGSAFAQQPRHRAVIATAGNARQAGETNTWTARILGQDGSELYRIAKTVPFDVPFPGIRVSTAGWSAVYEPFEGWLELFGVDGALVRRLFVFPGEEVDYERGLKVALSATHAAVLTSSPGRSRARVELFESTGLALWQADLPGGLAGEIAVSEYSRFILAGSYDPGDATSARVSLLDERGSLLGEIPALMRIAVLSEEHRIGVIAGREDIAQFSLPATEQVRRWSTNVRSRVVTRLGLWRGRTVAVVEYVAESPQGVEYLSPTLLVFDKRMQVTDSLRTGGRSFEPALLQINADSALLITAQKTTGLKLR